MNKSILPARLHTPACILSLLALSLSLSPAVLARPDVPANLGNGLASLVRQANANGGTLNRSALRPGIDNSRIAVFDSQNRVLVQILLSGRKPLQDVQRTLQTRKEFQALRIGAVSDRYRKGVIEAYVPLEKVAQLARLPEVAAVHLSPKPFTNVGLTTSQGVVQHRVDQLPAGSDGTGITVAALSDSYDTATQTLSGQPLTIHAAEDIASGDLPGPGNPLGNTQPVVVIQDGTGFDEGRAMLQIIHDLAPKAKLCNATADGGQTNFANNIRALADPNGPCKANVIVDDIYYLDEPMFADGIVSQAVDEVAAQGVSYFSSAGNYPSYTAYASQVRIVPGDASSLTGTNIKLTGVDPALYAGGFHNFKASGLDIAQTISISSSGGTLVFQWDDPYDTVPPQLGATLLDTSGTITAAQPVASFPLTATAGQGVSITADGVPTGSVDLVLTIIDPSGNTVTSIDTGTSPETFTGILPVSGTYTIQVSGFQGATGPFTLVANEAIGLKPVTSDFNLLFFDSQGNFVGAQADNNIVNLRPIEIASISGLTSLQLVIARANTPAATPTPASKLRYVWFTSGAPQEYYSYHYPTVYGHNTAKGASSTAAYGVFTPYIPESFTSPGPSIIYFDPSGNRLPRPEIRQKPDIAAADNVNTTFFGFDDTRDPDTFPNFSGTSAAAPHAAAIAALLLQKNGGPTSLTPTQVRSILKKSPFLHDLDPYFASGKLTVDGTRVFINVAADANSTSQFDTRVFRVAVGGTGSVSSILFDGTNGNPTEIVPGIAFDQRSGNPAPGFPFTVGITQGLSASDIAGVLGPTAPPPAVAGQSNTLTVSITPGVFTKGKLFTFGIDRDEQQTAFVPPSTAGGNSADLFGSGVLIPQGTIATGGVSFTVTTGSGQTGTGTFVNNIGSGYTSLDGYGFINAENALNQLKP
ncbi:S8 family serine peptidase [Gloeobacter kilaueensis]|uniref:Uncharacterized protein n=1 Tax=Gloeobacter kilaueensis (strain ATCC BAA-2537 / CCAP 1431/1 / ULC 316 / JS1) TaxID=1183438 RepID=U5QL75_GLOK1|nr:S8 family serine peptidase [Gloeobacter kilaueensis]AGY59638.1 hypothetical protein GKIL_3392 [Gloeobacter kilaueensis JS1]